MNAGDPLYDVKLKPCPWCKRGPRYYPTFGEDSSRAFRQIGCGNEQCKAKPITGDYSIDKLRRDAWNGKNYIATRLNKKA